MGFGSLNLFAFRMGFESCDCEWWVCSGFRMDLVPLLMGFNGGGGDGLGMDGVWLVYERHM